jgi:hypothetical protein
MSHASRNFVLAYVLLVGLPLVGLLGILKSGRSLTAPISVDGAWQLQVDPAQLAALPCGKTLAENAASDSILISQSGKSLTVSLPQGPKSSGLLQGNRLEGLVVASATSAAEPDCARAREFSLVATVDPRATPRSMDGTLSIDHCPSCPSVTFHGIRQPPPSGKELR